LPDYPSEYKELASAIHRDICMANPGVYFRDIIGLNEVKRLLKEAVLMPMKYPHLFTGLLEP
jgi:ATP-dependent 26S proteasome regulatory subunit